jgi:tetratricopeptide (TPR) repeat protein
MPLTALSPLLALLVLLAGGASPAQTAPAQTAPAQTSPAQGAPAQAATSESFESAAHRAQAAREAAHDAEAVAAYQAALALRPEWDEGLWYLGTLLYQSGRRAEADAVFERFLKVKPQAGPGWVLRGFCAFEDSDYKSAATRLHRGLGLGLGGNTELESVARLRLALSLIKTYDFELAIQPLTVVAGRTPEAPEVVSAVGLALLRMALVPSEIPAERQDLVRRTGRAGAYHLANRGSDAEQAYAELVAAYPAEPWVNYLQGVFLLRTDSERGIAALKRELQVSPTNVHACLDIAFELLKLQRNEEAKGAAERAVELAPTLFATHAALGRALVETGEVDRGIRELELAVGLAPESSEVHFVLARAYARAGRDQDAARERAEFARLEQARAAAGGTAPAGGGEVRP